MNIQKKKSALRPSPKPKSARHLFVDEGQQMLSSFAPRLLEYLATHRRKNCALNVTQAIYRPRSGKKVRFLGSTTRADTGERVPAPPKKFLPSQVLRRLPKESTAR